MYCVTVIIVYCENYNKRINSVGEGETVEPCNVKLLATTFATRLQSFRVCDIAVFVA
jgi:hypothetical protein